MNNAIRSPRECHGNFCTLSHPRCDQCGIDEALDILEGRLKSRSLAGIVKSGSHPDVIKNDERPVNQG